MGTAPRMPALAVALMFALHPAGALLAQDDGAMTKDQDAMQDSGAKGMMGPSAEGTITGANGHMAAGTVHVLDAKGKRQLHFTADFAMDKAPDTYVTLASGLTPEQGASTTVAKLTRFKGEQTFDLPAGVEPARYTHVVLWSKKQGKAMAQAELHAAGMKKDDAMGKKDGMMDKKDGMMEKDDAMEKKDGMMEKDDAMEKGGMEKDDAMSEQPDSLRQ